MGLFKHRDYGDVLDEIKKIILVIEDSQTHDTLRKVPLLAKRLRKLTKRLSLLDRVYALQLEQQFFLLGEAASWSQINRDIIPGILAAYEGMTIRHKQYLMQRAEKKDKAKIKRTKKMLTYGRLVTKTEFNNIDGKLTALESNQMIPAFEAPRNVVEWLTKINDKAVKNLYAQIGGTGNVYALVIFESDVEPVSSIKLRRNSLLIEVKFISGTPIKVTGVKFI